jgi:valyl-tRNA synthetase
MIIDSEWPSLLEYDDISAENFERLKMVVSEIRATNTSLSNISKGKKFGLLFGDDSLVHDNVLLVKFLSRVPTIASTNGTPRGLHLAIAGHDIYLDVPDSVIADYKAELTNKILAVGRELDALNARMMNPAYVERAPAALVKETRDAIEEKNKLIDRMKEQVASIEQ